ncbi:sigma-70 family RNA polymerase sigma factor [Bacillus thuringiensis]|uniref:RNA polymerase subunit sigma-24 n=15 Tax=Bacillus cereus group TaxID=86661 RepID=A0A9X6SPC2_BACTU|nr:MULTISPECIES: sigma-70 family RNA polymerase sigma factor [Bacillus]EEM40755.1 RNA polymerase sigma-70 factor, ECF subfamily [Bacillus thuringiensis serovar sotto str. T04001]MCP1320975.1 sigma-70 family RNA polymerase sigma factor [Bacillus sp. S0628]MED1153220.1 sigma-70 family RNA polymerase sigma factor [Bacillus paranthracis]NYS73710.1 sigma-70 family RNA polymerase sigma factor [Bacillus sp. BH32]ACK97260.1 RNA polymerase sigma-70 factor, ECF subfamily [Bacillus cereus G9842]
MKVIPLYKMIIKEETDVSLAKKGDHEAFITLIHTEKVKMYRIAKAMLRDETNIEDAIQTTILKAYENIKKLKKEEFFQTWLIRILMNECNNIIRAYKNVIVTEENDYNMSACDQYEDIDLYNAIQSLHEELRAVTVLYYYEDMNQDSIAKLLEIPKGTVKSRLSRAREQLQKRLKME